MIAPSGCLKFWFLIKYFVALHRITSAGKNVLSGWKWPKKRMWFKDKLKWILPELCVNGEREKESACQYHSRKIFAKSNTLEHSTCCGVTGNSPSHFPSWSDAASCDGDGHGHETWIWNETWGRYTHIHWHSKVHHSPLFTLPVLPLGRAGWSASASTSPTPAHDLWCMYMCVPYVTA